MQPSPRAETSRLLFPNVRFCILTPRCSASFRQLRLILLVAHMLQPIDGFTIKPLLNGYVRHSGGWRRTMPVFFSRLEPDYIPGPNLLDWATFALRPPPSGTNKQNLA